VQAIILSIYFAFLVSIYGRYIFLLTYVYVWVQSKWNGVIFIVKATI